MTEATKAKLREARKNIVWGPLTEEHKAKVSASLRGRKQSPEHIAHNQKARTKKRKPMSEEGRANCRAAKIGKVFISPEHAAKISASKKGKPLSQATRDGKAAYHIRKRAEKEERQELLDLLLHWR